MLSRKLVVVSMLLLGAAPPPRATGHRSGTARTSTAGRRGCRRPSPTSEVPGLQTRRDGKYMEPIGSGRDPLKVFTVAEDVDGRPAIRISGEVFGELRTKAVVQGLSPEVSVQVGREEMAAARQAGRRSATAACCITCTRRRAPKDAPGRARSSCRFRNTTSAISTRSDRRSPSAPKLAPGATAARSTTTIRQASGRYFSQSHGSSGRCIKQPDNEKPTGEWNTVELVAFDDDCIHIVNGKVVMRLHGPQRIDGDLPTPVTSGPIILQSEGAEVFYRDIQIRPITAIPAEFAAK